MGRTKYFCSLRRVLRGILLLFRRIISIGRALVFSENDFASWSRSRSRRARRLIHIIQNCLTQRGSSLCASLTRTFGVCHRHLLLPLSEIHYVSSKPCIPDSSTVLQNSCVLSHKIQSMAFVNFCGVVLERVNIANQAFLFGIDKLTNSAYFQVKRSLLQYCIFNNSYRMHCLGDYWDHYHFSAESAPLLRVMLKDSGLLR